MTDDLPDSPLIVVNGRTVIADGVVATICRTEAVAGLAYSRSAHLQVHLVGCAARSAGARQGWRLRWVRCRRPSR